jgi:hypothetical protein
MAAKVIRVDWAAWAASEATGRACGARCFLLSPPSNDPPRRRAEPFAAALSPMTPAEIRAATSAPRCDAWPDDPRQPQRHGALSLSLTPGEPHLPGVAEWLAKHASTPR